MTARRFILVPCVSAVLATTVFLAACTTLSVLAPIEPPPESSFDPATVSRGAELAAIGNCNVCHTAAGGRPYAGGRPLKTPFGTIYGTNITPDPDTGIGRWSESAFFRAMREGVDREGRHLYPAFPYDHYTKVTDEDIRALYTFVMTRDPVRAETPPNDLSFPFNIRSLIGAWKALYFKRGVFRPDATQSAEWNRGAYLVQGLGHCGACHTPRNFLGAVKKRQDQGGGEAEGWHAPALNAASPAPVPWDVEQLYRYLRTGLDDLHAIAAGPMVPVVRNLAAVPEQQVRAIATYVAALAGQPAADRQKRAADALSQARRDGAAYPHIDRAGQKTAGGDRALQNGAAVYAGACADCHDQGRHVSSGGALHLALGTAMTIPTSANLIRLTLEGVMPPDSEPGRWMPGFADALTDEQVRDLVTYIRAHFGREPPWPDVAEELRKARKAKAKP
jgi:mono/diheme cytochrome c family protein